MRSFLWLLIDYMGLCSISERKGIMVGVRLAFLEGLARNEGLK